MAQSFQPDNVLLSDTLGREVSAQPFTNAFLNQLVSTSKLIQLGERVDMGNQRIVRRNGGVGELSDAYFVDEGEKISTAKVEGSDYILETKKIGVILPVSEEFLNYTWSQYFSQIVPVIADKFNKKIDGAAFLGLHNNPFGNSVLAQAQASGNIVAGDLTAENIFDLGATTPNEPTAFVGHRTLNRDLRTITDADSVNGQFIFERPTSQNGIGVLDSLPYHALQLSQGEDYPDGTLLTGNFNGLKYGVPNSASLRLKIADQATLSTVQNTDNESLGDVHLFEQDLQALRAVFEIAVAIPEGAKDFAVLQPQASLGRDDDEDNNPLTQGEAGE